MPVFSEMVGTISILEFIFSGQFFYVKVMHAARDRTKNIGTDNRECGTRHAKAA